MQTDCRWIADIKAIEINDHILAFYTGRDWIRIIDEPNWVDDGAMKLGIATYAVYKNNKAVIYDTFADIRQAMWVRNHLENMGIKQFTVVLSHWHLDHIAGNEVYMDCNIISNARTRELLIKNKTDIESGCFDGPPEIHPLILPSIIFDKKTSLYLDDLQLELIHINIHSQDGTIIYIPGDNILFAGDALEDTITYIDEAENLVEHIKNLQVLKQLSVAAIFPNHGDPKVIAAGGYDKTLIDATINYITRMLERVHDVDFLKSSMKSYLGKELELRWVHYYEPYEAVHSQNLQKVYDCYKHKKPPWIPIPEGFAFPDMYRIHQRFDMPPAIDATAAVSREWERLDGKLAIRPGARIAVGVGSRGLSNLPEIVRAVVAKLKAAGAMPFITSAMGSHGGATAQGQVELLALMGVSEESVGAPVAATMEVVSIGEADGIPLYMDRLAHEADGIVLINRIKPHTDFTGPVESGIIKMLVIGLGNREGADFYHQMAVVRGFYDMLITAGRRMLQKTKFLFGVALVENQAHLTCEIRMATPEEMEATEIELLKKARHYLPKLPLDEIDLLIVDEMGKDISGAGLDPNVVGGKGICAWSASRPWPEITRIFVRDLTRATEGNASGMGMVHVTTPRLVNKIDLQATAINAITASCPEDCRIPLTLPTEKEAVATALRTIRPYTLKDVRIVHIKNTRELNHLKVSRGCLPDLENNPGIVIDPVSAAMAFDESGNLL